VKKDSATAIHIQIPDFDFVSKEAAKRQMIHWAWWAIEMALLITKRL